MRKVEDENDGGVRRERVIGLKGGKETRENRNNQRVSELLRLG